MKDKRESVTSKEGREETEVEEGRDQKSAGQ